MSEQKGYDPFSDENVGRSDKTDARTVEDDAMDELMTPSGILPSVSSSKKDDGWAPVEEETFTPPVPIASLESLIKDDEDGVEPTTAITSTASGIYDTPAHHNPLPGGDSTAALVGAASAPRTPSGRQKLPAPDSNEAILGSGLKEAVRAPLPAKSDAPPPPTDIGEPRPMAWILPTLVFVGGVGAGIYVLTGLNPILGGIAIALSCVGSLFLRVVLKQ